MTIRRRYAIGKRNPMDACVEQGGLMIRVATSLSRMERGIRVGLMAARVLSGKPALGPAEELVFPPISGEHLIVVRRVVDGDTLYFSWMIDDVARLQGINAPEVRGKDKTAGLAAKDFLMQLLPETPVLAQAMGRDKYGRTLLKIMLPDGRIVNDVLIESGHATPYMVKGITDG